MPLSSHIDSQSQVPKNDQQWGRGNFPTDRCKARSGAGLRRFQIYRQVTDNRVPHVRQAVYNAAFTSRRMAVTIDLALSF